LELEALPEVTATVFALALFQFLKKKNLSGLFWGRMWPITSLDSQVIPDQEVNEKKYFTHANIFKIPSHSPCALSRYDEQTALMVF
jgi:hypothetical protein